MGLCVWVWVWLIIKLKVKTESSKTRLKPCESHSWKIRNSLRPIPSLWRDLEREKKKKMSGGIARGRLAEERKAWRKNHPHVRSLSLSLSLSLFIFILNPSIFFFLTLCLYFCLIRVLWLSPRPVQMAPSIWWSGSASFLANLGSVLLFLFIYLFFLLI